MGSKKPNQDPPVAPPDYALAVHVFTQGIEAALDAEDYTKLNHALEAIQELRKQYPKAAGLLKFHAGISNMCAAMADNSRDINDHRWTAIICALEFSRCDPNSYECAFYLPYFIRNLTYDARGLNLALEACNRGLAIVSPDQRNWREQLHGLKAQCEAKLEILKQDRHQESQLGQGNRQKLKEILELEQPVDKLAKSLDASIPFKITQPQEISDSDAEKIRQLVRSLPTGPGFDVIEKTGQDAGKIRQLVRSLPTGPGLEVMKQTGQDSEKIRQLVRSLPTGPGLDVIEKTGSDAEKIRQLVRSLPTGPGLDVIEKTGPDAEKIRQLVRSLSTGPELEVMKETGQDAEKMRQLVLEAMKETGKDAEKIRQIVLEVMKKTGQDAEKIRQFVLEVTKEIGQDAEQIRQIVLEVIKKTGQDAEKIREIVLEVMKEIGQDAEQIRQIVLRLMKKTGQDAEKIRQLVLEVRKEIGQDAEMIRQIVLEVMKKTYQDQEEESRLQEAEVEVHVMSREIPGLFFAHMRRDRQIMRNTLKTVDRLGGDLSTLDAMLKYFPKDVPKDESSS